MRITTRGQLAVSAITDLAVRQQLRPIALSTISTRLGTSLSYLEQLFSALRRAGLVESTRGPGGGYTLARHPRDISVADIILAVETLSDDGVASANAGQAARVKSMTGELWSTFNVRVMEYLQSVSLQELVAQQRAKGVPVDEPEPVAAVRKLAPKPRPLMAKVGVPNSVFALGAMPILRRR
ncbi:MAG: Rrf2 family transcriptional regulator [Acidovorax sp.]|jgi:Rrf2 family iron-sulfur cluster assembly transcriptional regulator|uniref:Rrf2 family transcriptional regulator n=1 Tax=Acidovorax sp. TaxID=1872122 RepID=UPI000A5A4A19|nr:Rrf2 family transcriptional regulator [Acidovorax sp.]MCO4095074.1 Rrf2 family transcriptional regulator [Acidovorax sp.]MDH4427492.1 Rrf2 family transcriptional regulator [Acidovorax sp.]MDH4447649.1 Rrf2 family transcriptional regulator [Acidovorax sp.]MDH4466356.1 Rrf2 family transcriptional regulator [Acidovorax sp.]